MDNFFVDLAKLKPFTVRRLKIERSEEIMTETWAEIQSAQNRLYLVNIAVREGTYSNNSGSTRWGVQADVEAEDVLKALWVTLGRLNTLYKAQKADLDALRGKSL